MRNLSFVPSAEAAFIAGITDRQLNRVVDERLVPDDMLDLQGSTRRFARLAAAFARFYFDTEPTLVATARRDVVRELYLRVQSLQAGADILSLSAMPSDFNWKVGIQNVEIDVTRYVVQAYVNARKVDDAEALVTEDPEVMGGLPCFTDTRVPIHIVLASRDEGMPLDDLREDYPFLTDAHVAAARVYAEVHPRRGRPRRLSDVLGQPQETITVGRADA